MHSFRLDASMSICKLLPFENPESILNLSEYPIAAGDLLVVSCTIMAESLFSLCMFSRQPERLSSNFGLVVPVVPT
jgi:hypothetical protein